MKDFKKIASSITLIAAILFLSSCASKPYVTHTTIDRQAKTKVETICTHKTYIIPWYVGVAAGIFTIRGEKECKEVVSELAE